MAPSFADASVLDWLEAADTADFDEAAFGVIAMTADGSVVGYNAAEAALSGLTPARVIGRHFFSSVAPCTNNFLIAHRFDSESALDAIIDYVFTLRMAPTPVRLRLLKRLGARRMYLLVERRPAHEAG